MGWHASRRRITVRENLGASTHISVQNWRETTVFLPPPFADVRMKPATAGACRRQVENHILPVLGGKPALSLDRAVVSALHQGLGGTPAMANRVVEVLSRIYKSAEDRELIPEGTIRARRSACTGNAATNGS